MLHKDLNYFCFEIPYMIKKNNIISNTYVTKYIQLAIIQAFIALWEIKFKQMVVIWYFVSEDEDKWNHKYII